MEAVLAIVFILFSLVSAFMDRKRRAKQLEESRRQVTEQGGPPTATRPVLMDAEEEEEEEPTFRFPFGDPFELNEPKQAEAKPDLPSPEEIEQRRAKVLAAKAERKAKEIAEEGQKRRVQPTPAEPEPRSLLLGPIKPKNKWRLNPKKARAAVIYAEILNRPKWNPDND